MEFQTLVFLVDTLGSAEIKRFVQPQRIPRLICIANAIVMAWLGNDRWSFEDSVIGSNRHVWTIRVKGNDTTYPPWWSTIILPLLLFGC